VILGGSEETRLLLRGLLRLHHHRVAHEVRTADGLELRDDATQARVLILVVDSDSEDWTRELAIARDRQAGLLPLLVVPESTVEMVRRAQTAGVRGILTRPFAVRDLVHAVETIAGGGELFPPPSERETRRGQR
jgi:DNA-binding NarL/FixJ family response regulator